MAAHTSREKAERIITEFRSSGQTAKEFCHKKKINFNTFHWWLKRHRDSKKKNKASQPFVQVLPSSDTSNRTCQCEPELVIDFPSGTRATLRGGMVGASFSQMLFILSKEAAK